MTIKGVVTLQLDHPPFDLALGGYPTKKKKKKKKKNFINKNNYIL